MSIEHLNAAFKSTVKPSARKFVLVALADYANEAGLAYPSIQTLSNKTGQNRKTILKHLSALVIEGHIADTGQRVGRTKSIVKYLINIQAVPKAAQLSSPKNGTGSSPKNGTAKQSQIRDTEPSVLLTTNEPSVIIEYLNLKTGKNFRCVQSNTELVRARLKEGYTADEIKAVIDMKVSEWNGTDFQQYLRPETLFGARKFNQYAGNIGSSSGKGIGGLSDAEMANAI